MISEVQKRAFRGSGHHSPSPCDVKRLQIAHRMSQSVRVRTRITDNGPHIIKGSFPRGGGLIEAAAALGSMKTSRPSYAPEQLGATFTCGARLTVAVNGSLAHHPAGSAKRTRGYGVGQDSVWRLISKVPPVLEVREILNNSAPFRPDHAFCTAAFQNRTPYTYLVSVDHILILTL